MRELVKLPPGYIITDQKHAKRGRVRLRDKKAVGQKKKIVYRYPIDAREMLTSQPDRWELVDEVEAAKYGTHR